MGRAGLASEEGHHLPPTWRVLQDLRQGGSGASCQCQLEEGRLGQGWARGERSLCFTQRGAHRVKSGPALAQLSWAGPGPAWVWLAGSLSARSCGSEPGLRPLSLGFLERCPYSDRDSGTAVSSVHSILIRRGCYVP